MEMEKSVVLGYILECMGSKEILDAVREYVFNGGMDVEAIKEIVGRKESDEYVQ